MKRPLPLKVKALGRAAKSFSAAKLTREQIISNQVPSGAPKNVVTKWLMGDVVAGVSTSETCVRTPTHEIPLRIYRRDGGRAERRPVVLNIHGGGWAAGNLDATDWTCSAIARELDVVVVSVDYRLAPLNPWPAAPDDCYAALLDVASRAEEFGIDPDRIAVMGDSAGGNLSAVVTLMARDRSGPRIAHQTLIYPATDLRWTAPSIAENAHAPILGRDDLGVYRDYYVEREEDRTDPYVSPLLATDLSGLPPALIQVADHDPIRDDGTRYAERLRESGVPVRLTQYVASPHGYMSFPNICHAAPQAVAEICTELRSVFS